MSTEKEIGVARILMSSLFVMTRSFKHLLKSLIEKPVKQLLLFMFFDLLGSKNCLKVMTFFPPIC